MRMFAQSKSQSDSILNNKHKKTKKQKNKKMNETHVFSFKYTSITIHPRYSHEYYFFPISNSLKRKEKRGEIF